MCLVEIPAKYETHQKQVLVKPATTREVEISAQYEMQKVNKMIEPAHEEHIQIPAEYKTVTKTQKVSDGYWEWKKVEGCHAEENSAVVLIFENWKISAFSHRRQREREVRRI